MKRPFIQASPRRDRNTGYRARAIGFRLSALGAPVISLRPCNTHRRISGPRRGVASVLAMMFMVIFGSLAAAMAVVAQGNLRTADSGMKLSRAMSAAETGLTFATRRLASESSRFVVSKGVVDSTFANKLWMGTYNGAADGTVTVLPPTGYTVSTPPAGIIHAVRDAHLADSHSIVVDSSDSSLPAINTQYGTLTVRPIKLSDETNAPYSRLKYELVSGQPSVRVTSQGIDGDVQRTLQMDFTLAKKIEFAVISPNRIMIGKNVRVEGPLGSRYGIGADELNSANGDPLVMRSDFYYLDSTLNTKLNTLFTQIEAFDADGDNRLRPNDPAEAAGLSGQADLVDYNGDEYVDDYDLFMKHYDANNDHKVSAAEFTADPQLFRLIDQALPDRDGDGEENTTSDQGLGYNDGVLDVNDQYAKVHGRLAFAVARSPWDLANGASYQTVVNGAVRVSEPEDPPVKFEVTDEEMREITTAMFVDSQSWFLTQANAGASFASQAGTPSAGPGSSSTPNNWEATPFGADENSGADFGTHGAYDYYNRPLYQNKTFTNVKIPKGTNAVFKNCTFKGVTYLETETDTHDPNWNYTGAVEKKIVAGVPTYNVRFPSYDTHYGASNTQVLSDNNGGTKNISNNVRFDNCTFLGSLAGDKPDQYTHWRNKVQMTGNTRFYIDANDPDLFAQSDASTLVSALNSMSATTIDELKKSSILMPGWSIDVGSYTNEQGSDPTLTPKIKLKGAIVAGIMDVRGTADVFGTLLMTFRPVTGVGPLALGGLLDGFNTTIGYFYPSDGDGEGADPGDVGDPTVSGFGEVSLRYDPNAKLPDGIPWPVTMFANPSTYTE